MELIHLKEKIEKICFVCEKKLKIEKGKTVKCPGCGTYNTTKSLADFKSTFKKHKHKKKEEKLDEHY